MSGQAGGGSAARAARVLHIVEPRSGGGEEPLIACREAMGNDGPAGFEHTVWVIGGSAAEVAAAQHGLPTDDRLSPPMGAAALATRPARGLARRDGDSASGPRVVMCWSLGALAVARAVYPRLPRVAWVSRLPPGRATYWVSAAVDRFALGGPRGRLGTTLLTANPDVHAAWAAKGTVDVRLCAPPIAPVLPGAGAGAHPTDLSVQRAELFEAARAAAGDGGGSPPVLIALLDDPVGVARRESPGSDARTFAFVLGLLYTTGQRVIGVLSSGGTEGGGEREDGGRRRAARFVRAHGRQWGLLELAGPMERAVGACDVAMWSGRGGVTLAALAAAAGVPVVSADSLAARAVLRSAVEECIADRPGASGLAAKLLPMVEHAGRREEVGERLRAAAANAEADGRESFKGVLGALWRELVREARPRASGAASANSGSAAGIPAIVINTGAAG